MIRARWASRHLGHLGLGAALLLGAVSALGQDEMLDPTERAEAPPSRNPNAWNPKLEEYVVEPGDTLWAISERVVGSPWQWPRVWALNPEITNPHWIYPGDIVRFFPADLDLPSSTQLIADQRELPPVEDIGGTGEEGVVHEEPPKVEFIAPIRDRNGRQAQRRFLGLFVTEKELLESGKLTNAVPDKILLNKEDQVFFRFPSVEDGGPKAPPKRGDRYLVYRTVREVDHPVTGDLFGYITQVTGIAEIELNEPKVSRARLRYTEAEVERGQLVTPLIVDPAATLPKRSQVKVPVEGVVVAVNELPSSIASTNQFVFIDKGKDDGLIAGNELKVLTRGDGVTGEVEDLPWMTIGRLLVVDVKKGAATCLVLNSLREIEVGQKFSAKP